MRDSDSMIHHDSASALWELGWEAEDGSSADAIAQAKPSSRDPHSRAVAKRQIADDLRKMGTTVDAWFADIDTHATFLGKRIKASSGSVPGVHKVLLARLQRAEERLVKELRASSPADCGRQLNVYEVKGLRAPKPATGGKQASMHCYGLAIDINYRGNPFLQPKAESIEVIKRATQLVTGKAENVLSSVHAHDAGKKWDWLRAASEAFKQYLQLRKPENLSRLSTLVARSGGGRDAAAWQAQIAADYRLLDHLDSFVNRDPDKGFLDLDRRLVVALVEAGELLWGGMYKSKGKDLMHFDWRGPNGGGRDDPRSWLVEPGSSQARSAATSKPPPSSRSSGAGAAPTAKPRPSPAAPAAVAPSAAASTVPPADTSVPGLTIYAPISLGKDCTWIRKDGKRTCVDWFTLPARTGIYFPDRFGDQQEVDVILYFHGHLIAGCGNRSTDQIDRYWTRPKFLLREGLQQTGRPFVLVVPTLGPKSQSGLLHRAGGFDTYMKQVQAAITQHTAAAGLTKPREIGRIILSCHSGGGSTMRAIATGTGTYAKRISECWGFDCLYGDSDASTWAQWAQARRDARLYVHYTKRGGTKDNSEALRAKRLANVVIPAAPEHDEHCDVPRLYWQRRIQAALRTPGA